MRPHLSKVRETVFEYPMIDREPLEQWRHGRATLIEDAAHATYPVGSSGASQAIVDTRVLGAALRNTAQPSKRLTHMRPSSAP